MISVPVLVADFVTSGTTGCIVITGADVYSAPGLVMSMSLILAGFRVVLTFAELLSLSGMPATVLNS